MRLCLLLFILLATKLHAGGSLSAAGRLENRNGSCSAALVAPDLVVTAAHCIQEGKVENRVFRPSSDLIRMYPVERAVHHPLYKRDGLWKFRFDFALVKLITPVPPEIALPFPVGREAEPDEALFLLSWRWEEEPRQRRCPVVKGINGLVTLACRVQGGESGAPVIRKTDEGLELVAVVSSKSIQLQQPIAQASNLRNRLQPLLDRLEEAAEGS